MSNEDKPKVTEPVTAGFRRVVGDEPVAGGVDADAGSDSEQSGYALQKKLADKARTDGEGDGASGFYKKDAAGGENGFTLAGKDGNGGGFELGPAETSSIMGLGGKWLFVHHLSYLSDQHTAAYAHKLNPVFDKTIARAIKLNWQSIILQQGIAGRVAAPGPLNRALNRRIAFLASGTKEADKAIRRMGYRPDAVREQLKTLQSHALSPREHFELKQARHAAQNQPTPGTPAPAAP